MRRECRILRLVIEVKGFWNAELLTAPTIQLRDNYMNAYDATFDLPRHVVHVQ